VVGLSAAKVARAAVTTRAVSGPRAGGLDTWPAERTTKTWAHRLQRTFTPVSVSLSSAIRNFVLHFSHWTIMERPRSIRPSQEGEQESPNPG